MTAASPVHGQWLRQLRRASGWSVPQMVRELRKAAASTGDELPPKDTMIVMIHRWERGGSGISERYRLHYSTAFKTPVDRFGDPSILDALHANGISRMQAPLSQLGDPAKRDQMCFLLGYLSALMITTEPAPAPRHPVSKPSLLTDTAYPKRELS